MRGAVSNSNVVPSCRLTLCLRYSGASSSLGRSMMRMSWVSENGLLKRTMNDSQKWLPTRRSLNHLPSTVVALRPVPISMKLSGDSIWLVGRRNVTPTALRKLNPWGDILASVLPPKVSNTENLPPISMSPIWDLLFDSRGAEEMPHRGSVRICCALRTVRRFCDANGEIPVMGLPAPRKLVYRALNACTLASIAVCASVPTLGTNG